MKDYLKEFDGEHEFEPGGEPWWNQPPPPKKLSVKFEPSAEWGFEPAIKKGHIPIQRPAADGDQRSFAVEDKSVEEIFGFGKSDNRATLLRQKMDAQKVLAHLHNKQTNYPDRWTEGDERAMHRIEDELDKIHHKLNEGRISEPELKDLVSEAVLGMMNKTDVPPMKTELNESQKQEIEGKVRLCEARPGFMSMTFHDDFNKDECILGVRVDPTNNNDWVLTKEEAVHTLPYSYKEALYEFVKSIRNHD